MHKIFILLLTLTYISSESKNVLQIEIKQGLLKGKFDTTRKGRTIRAFTGIPFAKPPIGELRFRPPVPLDKWDGVLDATKPHNMCIQLDVFLSIAAVEGDEDCLYLNVYTPQLEGLSQKLLPVIFNIHGGGFISGKADLYGPKYLLDKDVVLVTTNYRLSSLGFISTGDKVVPGNNGLKDQNLALKWTKQNIAHFGGDPERITIFGESAGAACTHYHMLSPLSKDLIKGAIFDSGAAIGPLAYPPKDQVVRNTKLLAEFLNCPTASSSEMVDCMRKIDAKHLLEQDYKFIKWSYDPLTPFKPVVEPNLEGAFLAEDPIDIIKSGKAADVPIITGLTTEDGALKSAALYSDYKMIEDLNINFNERIPFAMLYEETDNKNDISKKIRKFYFGDKQIDNTTKDELTNMFTDSWFLVGQDAAVRLHLRYYSQPVYYFLFGYRGTVTFASFFGTDHNYDYGVCHVDELIYLFNFDGMFSDYTPSKSDEDMIDLMITLWTNFAKTGSPTPKSDVSVSVKWEPVKTDKLEYYFIRNAEDVKMSENMYPERVKFWRDLPTDARRIRIKDEL